MCAVVTSFSITKRCSNKQKINEIVHTRLCCSVCGTGNRFPDGLRPVFVLDPSHGNDPKRIQFSHAFAGGTSLLLQMPRMPKAVYSDMALTWRLYFWLFDGEGRIEFLIQSEVSNFVLKSLLDGFGGLYRLVWKD